MKKLCLISNSHLAALKTGWESIKSEYPEIEAVFFGAPGKHVESLTVAEHSLVPTTTAAAEKFSRFSGRTAISGEYDGFAICDLGIRAWFALRLYSEFRAETHRADDGIPVSDECFRLALLGLLRRSFAVKAVGKLRMISTAPIALVPAPMRSPQHPDPLLKAAAESGDDAALARTFESVVREIAAETGTLLFLQPPSTLIGPLHTNPLYARARVRAAKGDIIDKDHGHMNGRYGAAVLRMILAEMFGEISLAQRRKNRELERSDYRAIPRNGYRLATTLHQIKGIWGMIRNKLHELHSRPRP